MHTGTTHIHVCVCVHGVHAHVYLLAVDDAVQAACVCMYCIYAHVYAYTACVCIYAHVYLLAVDDVMKVGIHRLHDHIDICP